MKEIQELEDKYGAPLVENYIMGPQVSSGVFLEGLRCVRRIDAKKLTIKVIRKKALTLAEAKHFKGEI